MGKTNDDFSLKELTLLYRLLSHDPAPAECKALGVDRADMMRRLLLRIVPPLETCEAHEARCTEGPDGVPS